MPIQVKPIYNCAQKDLYSALETLWDNYDDNIAAFTLFSASYDAAVATAGRALIDAAKTLPDDQARGEAAETLRIALVDLGKIARKRFKFLRGYIRKAFDKSVWKPKIEAAGQGYFAGADAEDWESIKSMYVSMNNFIVANSVALLAANNMPATFKADTLAASVTFNSTYGDFKTASDTGTATAAKIAANNKAYSFAIDGIVYDATTIFEDDAELSYKFIFDRILNAINPGTSGVRGNVEEAVTNIPLGGAQISFKAEGKEAILVVCDDEGDFEKELAADTYAWEASVALHVTLTGSITVTAGVRKTLNIELVKS